MKIYRIPLTVKCALLVLAASWFSGCSSIGFKTGDSTATSFQRASRQLQAESGALDKTIAALDNIVNNPANDLKPQFKAFSRSLEHLIDSIERTDKAIAKTREESSEYFKAWDEELSSMNFGIIRSHSESRETAVSNQVYAVCQRYEETQGVVRPLISYFSDIQRALGTDLTGDGVAAVREIVAKAAENTRKIQLGLAQLSSELRSSGERLSSVIASKRAAEPESANSQPERVAVRVP